MSHLNGKIAVVTGGNSGIGYYTAKKLKEDGATVIITGRSAEKVETAANELGVKGLVADVLDLSAIDSTVTKVKFNNFLLCTPFLIAVQGRNYAGSGAQVRSTDFDLPSGWSFALILLVIWL